MPKGFDPRCGAGKTARVYLTHPAGVVAGKGRSAENPARRWCCSRYNGERMRCENSLVGSLAPPRQTLIDKNERHVSVIMCETDYSALKRSQSFLQNSWGAPQS